MSARTKEKAKARVRIDVESETMMQVIQRLLCRRRQPVHMPMQQPMPQIGDNPQRQMPSFKRKILRATFKAILILKLRIIWSRLGSWLNVHNAMKNSMNRWESLAYQAKSSLRGKVSNMLAKRHSRMLCEHLTRESGKLVCSNPIVTELP